MPNRRLEGVAGKPERGQVWKISCLLPELQKNLLALVGANIQLLINGDFVVSEFSVLLRYWHDRGSPITVLLSR